MKTNGEGLEGQPLVEHLRELRFRLIRCLIALFVLTIICYSQVEKIFDAIRMPIVKYLPGGGLIYTGPLDKFLAHIKIAVVCGVILSCPFWLYQIWKFVAPGLYKNEKKYTVGFLVSGTTLFLLGVGFAYFVALPAAFEFLFHYGGDIDKPMISIEQYLGFLTQVCLMFGVSFELPLILVTLGLMGLVSQAFLRKNRRYAIMIMAVASGIITPPDLMSMLFLLVPMLLLYEIGVIMVGFFEKKNAAAF